MQKNRLLTFPVRRRILTVLPLLFAPASRQKPHQVQQTLYPSAITGGPVTACRCPLNRTFALRLSRLNRFSNASPKPSSICACTSLSVSELLHKVNLYHSLCRRSMTSTASQPASKKSSGDFPVVRCTHVLSSSMSFPYGKYRNTFPMVCKRGNINLRLLYTSQFWFRISR